MLDEFLSEKYKPALVGLCQAVGVILYVALVAGFMWLFTGATNEEPGYFGIVVMLTLLVFSAGITGTLVFGLPVYFAFAKNNVKRAISILAYTFLSLFVILFLAALTILTVY